jgi:hypothetical protein
MPAAGKADDSIRKVFTLGGLGVHVGNLAVVVAGLAEITDGRLMDWEEKTVARTPEIRTLSDRAGSSTPRHCERSEAISIVGDTKIASSLRSSQ